MALRYRARLLAHLSHDDYRPADEATIRRAMRVSDDDVSDFRAAVETLVADDRVEVGAGGKLRLASMPDEIEGKLRVNQRGFGFLIPDHPYREGDLFIPANRISDAVSGDRVRAKVMREKGGGRIGSRSGVSGTVLEVVERGNSKFTGVLYKQGPVWLVEPDGRIIHQPVVIRDPHVKNAKEGDKVVIQLTLYPEGDYNAEGVITEVLGEAGQPDVETQAVIAAYGLHTEFSDETIETAESAARRFETEREGESSGIGIGLAEREDLTNRFIFTIDPKDSKDFDDAISIAYDDKQKEWELGVHIADVAHFVRPGDPLDVEASQRGNSSYLPRLVIPMLPGMSNIATESLRRPAIGRCASRKRLSIMAALIRFTQTSSCRRCLVFSSGVSFVRTVLPPACFASRCACAVADTSSFIS